MSKHILHVDMNAFYASVEQQRRPELREKPVAVCGSQEARHGIVLTASYPAKKRGVKTGMAIWQAQQHCPELVVLPPDMAEYIRFSQLAREIYADYTDQIEPFGLDEAWLDVTGSTAIHGTAMEIAEKIRERIRFELGITVSIGVADNKITAKLGSDYKKPDAITRIEKDNYEEIVYPLPVQDLLYVGPATKKKLNRVGIFTIGQLARSPEDFLRRRLGKMGGILHMFANGRDISPVLQSDHISTIKSVGNSATTPRDLINNDDVRLMLYLLSESVCSRMRDLGVKCTTVEIYVRDTDLHSFSRQKKLTTPSCTTDDIVDMAYKLFCTHYNWDLPIRSIGVRGVDLIEGNADIQLSMFEDNEKKARRERLDAAVDELRQRYGYTCVRRAVVLSDPLLGQINPKDDHTVHPVGYFGRR